MSAPTRLNYTARAEVWIYPGKGGWHFLTLPERESAEIREVSRGFSQPWGTLPALATIGGTRWRTYIAPDRKTRAHHLPLKAAMRKEENIRSGDRIRFQIEILPRIGPVPTSPGT
jgi:hypothetical protein